MATRWATSLRSTTSESSAKSREEMLAEYKAKKGCGKENVPVEQNRFGFKPPAKAAPSQEDDTNDKMEKAVSEVPRTPRTPRTPRRRPLSDISTPSRLGSMTPADKRRKLDSLNPVGSFLTQLRQRFEKLVQDESCLTTRITAAKFDYKNKIEQQIALIKALRAVVREAVAIRNDITSFLSEFENQWAKAEERRDEELLNMKKELTTLRDDLEQSRVHCTYLATSNTNLHNTLQTSSEELEAVSKAKKEIESERDGLLEAKARLEDSVAELTKSGEAKSEELLNQQQKSSELVVAVQQKEEELKVVHARLEEMTSEKDKVSSSLESTTQKLGLAEGERDMLKSSNEESLLEVKRLSEDIRTWQAKLEQKESDMREQVKMFQTSQTLQEKRVDELREEKDKAVSSVETLRGELATVTGEIAQLKNMAANQESEILRLKEGIADAKTELEAAGVAKTVAETRLDETRRIAEVEREELEGVKLEMAALRPEAQRLKEEGDILKEKNERLMGENQELREKTTAVSAELRTFKENIGISGSDQMHRLAELQSENAVLKDKLATTAGSVVENSGKVSELQARIKELLEQHAESESNRRKLHNQLQELRGKVRVLARVRPSGPEELPCPINVKSNNTVVDISLQKEGEAQARKHAFSFDHVFGQEASQADVWTEVEHLVQSALDGYKVCLLAYGQTGSGKTHTMIGTGGSDEMKGIIPRSMKKIMQQVRRLAVQGWNYTMKVSFIEVYNEEIRDLLREDPSGDQSKHQIKHDQSGRMYVSDVNLFEIKSPIDVDCLMDKATANRSVGKTDMNARSSRSHCIFTLYLTGVNEEQGQTLEGALNLVDLAGSERLAQSKATGDRLKETQAINKSLSSLGDVFTALSKKQSHIPFRNSKLTYFLQPCLSGDGKAMVIINLSPAESSGHESLCSLRFSGTVGSCELGKPTKNVKSIENNASAAPAPPPTRPSTAGTASSSTVATSSGVRRPSTAPLANRRASSLPKPSAKRPSVAPTPTAKKTKQ